MSKTMLIDAAHAEEVRVCVLENGKVEDFDFESSSRKPLRGNIYLARVTRVEPSLQAAFVEYGGNRHGFLAFNEIHPDYYQIPVSDRRLLQEAEAEETALAAELDLEQQPNDRGDNGGDDLEQSASEDGADSDEDNDASSDDLEAPDFRDSDPVEDDEDQEAGADADGSEQADDVREAEAPISLAAAAQEEISVSFADESETSDAFPAEAPSSDAQDAAPAEQQANDAAEESDQPVVVEEQPRVRGAKRAELMERYREARRKRARLMRNYKIQEVIKRRQILLIQVVKEERGNKGAALTTYLSLAGRYCVLMPNTARGGGISRKIPVAADRKRLRRVVDDLGVPPGIGLIIRTAGAKRTKAEIKRDYEYLIRLWETIRELTLKSIAPCLIYEEASLIKRAIRDLYDKDIDKIVVQGEDGYREAKDFMKMLMPSHAKNVQPYREKAPLFLHYNVESQLDAMYQPTVRLKSGGYLVIHQTEALIAIDVNSGKATRERNIELTALKTNLEAAKEAARQCRMRDLAGLIVIDFIDMEEGKNNRAVEKKLKDALKSDRARIQVGRISNFGLLEMSRQRRRSGIIDGTTHDCPTCGGSGAVRSDEMAALRILRAIETEAITNRAAVIAVKTSLEVALYILNHKRAWLNRIETDYAITVEVVADSSKAGDQYEIERRGAPRELPAVQFIRADHVAADEPEEQDVVEETSDDEEEDADETAPRSDAARTESGEDGERRGRRRRRRRRGRREDGPAADAPQHGAPAEERMNDDGALVASDETDDGDENSAETGAENAETSPGEIGADGQKKRRRRGRRGGRRNRRVDGVEGGVDGETPQPAMIADDAEQPDYEPLEVLDLNDAPTRQETVSAHESPQEHGPQDQAVSEQAAPKEVTKQHTPPPVISRPDPEAAAPEEQGPATEKSEAPKSTRKGWWQRALSG